jgi:hypothetical protein
MRDDGWIFAKYTILLDYRCGRRSGIPHLLHTYLLTIMYLRYIFATLQYYFLQKYLPPEIKNLKTKTHLGKQEIEKNSPGGGRTHDIRMSTISISLKKDIRTAR